MLGNKNYKLSDSVIIDENGGIFDTLSGRHFQADRLIIDELKSFKNENIYLSSNLEELLWENNLLEKTSDSSSLEQSKIYSKNKGIFGFSEIPFSDFINNLEAEIVFLGIPFDLGCVTIPGSRLGPEVLRTYGGEVLWSLTDDMKLSGFYDYSMQKNRINNLRIFDIGNIGNHTKLNKDKLTSYKVLEYYSSLLSSKNTLPIFIGGDHSITGALVNGLNYKKINVIHIDAHSDDSAKVITNYEQLQNNNIISYLNNLEKVNKIYSIGLRDAVYIPKSKKVERFSIDSLKNPNYEEIESIDSDIPTYISIDVDVLDPIFIPNTGSLVAGGITDSELIIFFEMLFQKNKNLQIIGIDIVELLSEQIHNERVGVVLTNIILKLISILFQERSD